MVLGVRGLKASRWNVCAALITLVLISFPGCQQASQQSALIVDPGDSVDVVFGPNTLGQQMSFTQAQVTLVNGETLDARILNDGTTLRIKYPINRKHNFLDKLTVTAEVAGKWPFTLTSYLAFAPTTIDFSTTKQVAFFETVLGRVPKDVVELQYVGKFIDTAVGSSCMIGTKLHSSDLLKRVLNNAIYDADSWSQLRNAYNLTNAQAGVFVAKNTPPKVGPPANPAPSLTDTSVAVYTEADPLARIQVKIKDGDLDFVRSRWKFDGKDPADVPDVAVIADDEAPLPPEASAEFQLPKFLTLKPNYLMANRDVQTKVYDVKLELCDGGKAVLYDYNIDIRNQSQAPEFTVIPTDVVALTPGVATFVDLQAKDADGDKISFRTSTGVNENFFFVPPGVTGTAKEVFEKLKKPTGVFVFNSDARDRTKATTVSASGDPWFEAVRGPDKKVAIPTKIEFMPDTNQAIVTGLSASPQTVPTSFDFLRTPTGAAETLKIHFGGLDANNNFVGLNITSPVVNPNAELFCYMTESGARDGYSMGLSCNYNHYPKNLTADGDFHATFSCPDKNANPPIVPAHPELLNIRCAETPGTLVSVAGAVPTVYSSRLVIQPERYQGPSYNQSAASSHMSLNVTAVDDFQVPNTQKIDFSIAKNTSQGTQKFNSFTLFDQYAWQGENPSAQFTRKVSANKVSYNLLSPYTYNSSLSQVSPWIGGSSVIASMRIPMPTDKSYWWQAHRWDLMEEHLYSNMFDLTADPDLEIFSGRYFIRFVPPSDLNQDPKLILSARTADIPADGKSWKFDTRVSAARSLFVQNVVQSDVFKYQVLQATDNWVIFKVLNAKVATVGGVTKAYDIVCRGDWNYDRPAYMNVSAPNADAPAMDADWHVRCGDTQADAEAKDTWVTLNSGAHALFTATPGSGTQYFETQDSNVTPIRWYPRRCIFNNGGTEYGCSSQYNGSDPLVYNQFYGIALFDVDGYWDGTKFDVTQPDPSITLAGKYSTWWNYPVVDADGSSLARGYTIWPRTHRLQFPDSTAFRYCRYGLRNRMTLLILTCTNVAPTTDWPTLYGGTDGSTITLEFNNQQYSSYVPPNHNLDGAGVAVPLLTSAIAPPATPGATQSYANPIYGVGNGLMSFMLAYDAGSADSPRDQNRNAIMSTPSVSAKLYKTDGGTHVLVNNPGISIYIPDPDGYASTVHNPNDSGPIMNAGDIGLRLIGAGHVGIAMTSPKAGGLFDLEITLQDNQAPDPAATQQTFVTHLAVDPAPEWVYYYWDYGDYYSYPWCGGVCNGQDTGDTLNYSGIPGYPGEHFYKNDINGNPQTINQWITSQWSGTAQLYRMGKSQSSIYPFFSNLVAERPLGRKIQAFWLVDDQGKLVDPDPSNEYSAQDGAGHPMPWWQVWPFDANGNVNNRQIKVGGADDPVFTGAQSQRLVPASVGNLMAGNVKITGSNLADLRGQPDSNFEFIKPDKVNYTNAVQDPYQNKLTIKLWNRFYEAVMITPSPVPTDPEYVSDFQVKNIDNSNHGAVGTDSLFCRTFAKHPIVRLIDDNAGSPAPTVVQMKTFCTVNGTAFAPPVPTSPPNYYTTIDNANPAGMIAFMSSMETPLVPANKITFQTIGALQPAWIADDPWYQEYLAESGWSDDGITAIQWGSTTATGSNRNKIFANEAPGKFRGVLVVTDGMYEVGYMPLEFDSLNTDDTVIPQPNKFPATGTLNYCNFPVDPARYEAPFLTASDTGGHTLPEIQALQRGKTLDLSCLLPEWGPSTTGTGDYDDPDRATTWWDMRFLKSDPSTLTGGQAITGWPGERVDAMSNLGVDTCSGVPCTKYGVDTSIWTSYLNESQFQPSLERQKFTTAGGEDFFRWEFKWQIPAVPLNQIQPKRIEFFLNPSIDHPRRMVASEIAQTHYTIMTKRNFDTTTFTQVTNGARDITGQRKLYPAFATAFADDKGTMDDWYHLDFRVVEPNQPPCLITPSTFNTIVGTPNQPSTIGLACASTQMAPTVDGSSNPIDVNGDGVIDSNDVNNNYTTLADSMRRSDDSNFFHGGKPSLLTRYIAPPNDATLPEIIYEFEYVRDSLDLSASAHWIPILEKKEIQIPFWAYDPSLSADNSRQISSISPESSSYPIMTVAQEPQDNTKYYILKFTPRESMIDKSGLSGNLYQLHYVMSDKAGKQTRLTIQMRLWDVNNAPEISAPTSTGQIGSNNLAFSLPISDEDKDDQILVSIDPGTLPPGVAAGDITLSSAAGLSSDCHPLDPATPVCAFACTTVGNCQINGTVNDLPQFKGLGTLTLNLAVSDQPWWKLDTNPTSHQSQYYAAHPYTSGGANSYLAPALEQSLQVSFTETVSPQLTSPATYNLTINRNQQVFLPITTKNYTGGCSITQNIVPPAGVNEAPPSIVAQTVLAGTNTVLPGNTPCTLVWKPTVSGWSSLDALHSVVKIAVGTLGTVTVNFTFNSITAPPGPVGSRASFYNSADLQASSYDSVSSTYTPLNAYRESTDVASTSPRIFVAGDDDTVVLTLNDIASGLPASSAADRILAWYYDDKPVLSGSSSYTLSPSPTSSGLHKVSVLYGDGSIVPQAAATYGEQKIAIEAGYQIFNYYLYLRNTQPIATASGTTNYFDMAAPGINLSRTNQILTMTGIIPWNNWFTGLYSVKDDTGELRYSYSVNPTTNVKLIGSAAKSGGVSYTVLDGRSISSPPEGIYSQSLEGAVYKYEFDPVTPRYTIINPVDLSAGSFENAMLTTGSRFYGLQSEAVTVNGSVYFHDYSNNRSGFITSTALMDNPQPFDTLTWYSYNQLVPIGNSLIIIGKRSAVAAVTAEIVTAPTHTSAATNPISFNGHTPSFIWVSNSDRSGVDSSHYLTVAIIDDPDASFPNTKRLAYGHLNKDTGAWDEAANSISAKIRIPDAQLATMTGPLAKSSGHISPIEKVNGPGNKIPGSGAFYLTFPGSSKFIAVDLVKGVSRNLALPLATTAGVTCVSTGTVDERCAFADSKNLRIYIGK